MGWQYFPDAMYTANLSDLTNYIKKSGWNPRCPDCESWIFNIPEGWEKSEKFGVTTHWFKECHCGAQLTIFYV